MTNYSLVFGAALLVNCLATFRSSDYWKKIFPATVSGSGGGSGGDNENEEADEKQKKAWTVLIKKYLFVYLLATLSDWLQGPYVYALYSDYGYTQHEIAVLFVAGFGSSMIFGSFIGGMADWGGRRAFVVLFAIIYAASCITKHFHHFWVLMLGRLLGGIATSLLFSVFEAWLIRSHADAGLKAWLGRSFSWAAYGNSVIAIAAGLVANWAASAAPMVPIDPSSKLIYVGGFLNPFDIALLALLLCGFVAMTTWEENYGDQNGGDANEDGRNRGKWYDGLRSAFVATCRSTDVLLCGLISSLFEGSMYIFVFMWTPALKAAAKAALLQQDTTDAAADTEPQLPFGLIFSTFMVCCMAGSSVFSLMIQSWKVEQLGVVVLGTACIAMMVIAVCPVKHQTFIFVAMNMFEMTVGMYWPVMGTLKGSIVPESKRAAIYNLFRIPLNFIVLFSLLTDLTPTQSFTLNSLMLGSATVMQIVLMKRREKNGMTDSVTSSPKQVDDDDNSKNQETIQLVENAMEKV